MLIIYYRELGCTICGHIIQDVDTFIDDHTTEEEISTFLHGVSAKGCLETIE